MEAREMEACSSATLITTYKTSTELFCYFIGRLLFVQFNARKIRRKRHPCNYGIVCLMSLLVCLKLPSNVIHFDAFYGFYHFRTQTACFSSVYRRQMLRLSVVCIHSLVSGAEGLNVLPSQDVSQTSIVNTLVSSALYQISRDFNSFYACTVLWFEILHHGSWSTMYVLSCKIFTRTSEFCQRSATVVLCIANEGWWVGLDMVTCPL